tara:strand:+ start:481 stop:1155 length:675 start_codon:yes stop_codon:yes gene_type:complete
MGLTTNLSGFYGKRYEGQYGNPVAYSKSRMNAIADIMARGVITEWGASEPDCPEDKFVAKYKRRWTLFTGWKYRDLSSNCNNPALKEQSVNEVRSPLSPNRIECSTLLAAMELVGAPGGEIEAAQGRLDGCGSLSRTCKRKAKIDLEKWNSTYSILNSYYRSGGENYLDCTTQQIEDDQQETLDLLNALIEQREQNPGINNTSLLISIGVGIVGLTYITLKFIK